MVMQRIATGLIGAMIVIFGWSTVTLANPVVLKTFEALIPTSTYGSLTRVQLSDSGTLALLFRSTGFIGSLSADGSRFTVVSLNTTIPAYSGGDLCVSGNTVYISTTSGASGRLLRYDLSETGAYLVASLNASGVGTVAKRHDGTIFSTRFSYLRSYDGALNSLSPTTSLSTTYLRTAFDPDGNLYGISSLGRLDSYQGVAGNASAVVSGLASGTHSLNVNRFAVYVGAPSAFKKFKLNSDGSATLLWSRSYADTLGGFDIRPDGRIVQVLLNGTAQELNPIATVLSVDATANNTGITLTIANGIADTDFAGVMIRRSLSGYPATPTDGVLVTRNMVDAAFTDSPNGLETHYYTVFNETVDGFFGGGVTVSVTPVDTHLETPSLQAFKSRPNGREIGLSWTVPSGAGFVSLFRSRNQSQSERIATVSSSVTSWVDQVPQDGAYTYFIRAESATRAPSEFGQSEPITVDATPPPPHTQFGAGRVYPDSTVLLYWTPTVDPDIAGVVLLRSTSGFSTPTSGMTVTQNPSSDVYIDRNLPDGLYYYSLFTVDHVGNFSRPVTASVAINSLPPNPVAGVVSSSGFRSAVLAWFNPLDSDFSGVTIRRDTVSFPTLTSGVLVTDNQVATQLVDSDLDPGQYHYSLFAKDVAGNVSSVVTVSIQVLEHATSTSDFVQNGWVDLRELQLTENRTAPVNGTVVGYSGRATLDIQAAFVSNGAIIGRQPGAEGVVALSTGLSNWTEQGSVIVGQGGSGRIVQSAGAVTIANDLVLGRDAGSTGVYELSGGTLSVGGLVVGGSGSGTFNWSGGTLAVSRVTGNVSNLGAGVLHIDSQSALTITGNYLQSGEATLQFYLNDAINNPSFGTIQSTNLLPLLRISGTASLQGTVRVSIGSYRPQPGDRIQLTNPLVELSSIAIRSTMPIVFDLPDLPDHLVWDTSLFLSQGVIQIQSVGSALVMGSIVNFPNPFRLSSGTQLGYRLSRNTDIDLRIYTSTGAEVFRHLYATGTPGGAEGYNKVSLNHQVLGQNWSAGIYFYVLIADGKVVGKGKLAIKAER